MMVGREHSLQGNFFGYKNSSSLAYPKTIDDDIDKPEIINFYNSRKGVMSKHSIVIAQGDGLWFNFSYSKQIKME